MPEFSTILLVIGFLVAMGFAFYYKLKEDKKKLPFHQNISPFTKTEFKFFIRLTEFIQNEYGDKYHVLSKIRLADIFESTLNSWEDRRLVIAKHIDFILIEKNTGNLALCIELDDKYHNNDQARKNDAFKDALFRQSRIPLLRFVASEAYPLGKIKEYVK